MIKQIANELNVAVKQVVATVEMLDGGATVPFIARYRKEATGGLDDGQLRQLEERLRYLRELEARRESILKSISKQGLLTPELEKSIRAAATMTRLEDLYLPYKPKRRSKAQQAREAGLQPLLDSLLQDMSQQPEAIAADFVNSDAGIDDVEAALAGAQHILMERLGENAEVLATLRDYMHKHAVLTATVVKKKAEEGEKFKDYFEFSETWKKVPSHRALAIFRGQKEGVLRAKLLVGADEERADKFCQSAIAKPFAIAGQGRAADAWLLEAVRLAWKTKILMRLEVDLLLALRTKAEEEAIKVFANNLRDLLLAAPAGQRATMGLDPGLRSGVKVAVTDVTGKVLDTAVIYPHVPARRWDEALAALAVLADKHQVDLVAIGNGTGSRETESLIKALSEQFPQLHLTSVIVSEAGASVYSASELAANEFPDMDVTLRGAVSIARRLQDPLAELVKIEPKAIGVGQYQHDVNQAHLARTLDAVVEDCVNRVGVDVNTASAHLLAYVAGLSKSMAENLVAYRDEHGRFPNRDEIHKVKGVGPKAFEQAAGFLRILDGENPLDASAVHPEAYPVVEKVAAKKNMTVEDLLGNQTILHGLKAKDFVSDTFGELTVADIFRELEKPGRDPRPEFKTATFRSGVNEIRDLKEGMILEGVVSNVANFGAFVDIGVHQDGLVHISALASKFVDDPRKVVKTGDVVKVKVLEADAKRKRISLTMRLQDELEPLAEEKPRWKKSESGHGQIREPESVQQKVKRQMHKQKQHAQKQEHKKGHKKDAPMSALEMAFAKALNK
ncbi:MAG: RNA-binding transcriptional accessory protein [Mariprofundaceae bacterium]|nr:RNA-binding transcriptional accessory protein [Mariprofundaceae bacterium]